MNKEQTTRLVPASKPDREAELKPLMGLPLRHLSRSFTTLRAHFGELREVDASGKKISPIGEWVLEVFGPCPWRMTQNGRVYAGSGDFEESFGGDDCDPRDKYALTRFDLMSYFFHNEFAINSPVLDGIEMDGMEGFTMKFGDRLKLVVFPSDSDVSLDPRYWRLAKSANR